MKISASVEHISNWIYICVYKQSVVLPAMSVDCDKGSDGRASKMGYPKAKVAWLALTLSQEEIWSEQAQCHFSTSLIYIVINVFGVIL